MRIFYRVDTVGLDGITRRLYPNLTWSRNDAWLDARDRGCTTCAHDEHHWGWVVDYHRAFWREAYVVAQKRLVWAREQQEFMHRYLSTYPEMRRYVTSIEAQADAVMKDPRLTKSARDVLIAWDEGEDGDWAVLRELGLHEVQPGEEDTGAMQHTPLAFEVIRRIAVEQRGRIAELSSAVAEEGRIADTFLAELVARETRPQTEDPNG